MKWTQQSSDVVGVYSLNVINYQKVKFHLEGVNFTFQSDISHFNIYRIMAP